MSEPEGEEGGGRTEPKIEVPERHRLRLGRAFPGNEAIRSLRARTEFGTLETRITAERMRRNPLANFDMMIAAATTQGVAENREHWNWLNDDVKQLFSEIVRLYGEGLRPGGPPVLTTPFPTPETPPPPPGAFVASEDLLKRMLAFAEFVFLLQGRIVVEGGTEKRTLEITGSKDNWALLHRIFPLMQDSPMQVFNHAALIWTASKSWYGANLVNFGLDGTQVTTDDQFSSYLAGSAGIEHKPFGFAMALLFFLYEQNIRDIDLRNREFQLDELEQKMVILEESGILAPTLTRKIFEEPDIPPRLLREEPRSAKEFAMRVAQIAAVLGGMTTIRNIGDLVHEFVKLETRLKKSDDTGDKLFRQKRDLETKYSALSNAKNALDATIKTHETTIQRLNVENDQLKNILQQQAVHAQGDADRLGDDVANFPRSPPRRPVSPSEDIDPFTLSP